VVVWWKFGSCRIGFCFTIYLGSSNCLCKRAYNLWTVLILIWRQKLTQKNPPANGTRGIGKLSALVQNQGQPSHFVLYLMDVRMSSHGSGTEGCQILKHWHRRNNNFFRGKSRILITFRGTQGILSISKGYNHSHSGDKITPRGLQDLESNHRRVDGIDQD
jgi:hypothetical protein